MTRTVTKPSILVSITTTFTLAILIFACNLLKIEVQQPIGSLLCAAAKVASMPVTQTFSNSTGRNQASTSVPGVPPVKPLASIAPSSQYQLNEGDLSLWIDQEQVKLFSGFPMEIHVIADGRVLPYILDPQFSTFLPVIPSEVSYVNFTWKSGGNKKYFYHFDRLVSSNEEILHAPIVSVDPRGRIPRKPKVFSVLLPCSGTVSGIAAFSIGLMIESKKGKPLSGTPIRLKLRKECAERVDQIKGGCTHLVLSSHASTSARAWSSMIFGQKELTASSSTTSETIRIRHDFTGSRHGPDPECDKKCSNGGWCNHEKMCLCMDGYMGRNCETALCYPQCMNGGICSAPGICSCSAGFQGLHCEGGICKEKCLNGGKCVQKDTCDCPKGFYGPRCQYTQCVIPCLNGGRCRGVNKCRCQKGFHGNHCEALKPGRMARRYLCKKPCQHGVCSGINRCLCHEGWLGKQCNRINQQHNTSDDKPVTRRRKIWV